MVLNFFWGGPGGARRISSIKLKVHKVGNVGMGVLGAQCDLMPCSTSQLPKSSCRNTLKPQFPHRREETRPAPHLLRPVFLTVLELSLDSSHSLEKNRINIAFTIKGGKKVLFSDNHPIVLNTEMSAGSKCIAVNTLY